MYDEVRHIISEKVKVRFGTTIQVVASYLTRSLTTSPLVEEHKPFKTEETKRLIEYIEVNNLWIGSINLDNYVSEGVEQKVYINNENTVIKLNDSIYA